MREDFVRLTPENLEQEHICCIIRSKKPHPGIEAKKRWLADRLKEGHVFWKLPEKGVVFIEYAPLETAWVPIRGERYYYLYCLWVDGAHKGKGYGKALLEGCIADAVANGKAGVCMLGSLKQKAWLSDQAFARKYGFQVVDTTAYGYELLALSFDGTYPRFSAEAKQGVISKQELTIYYDRQCPYIEQSLRMVRKYCAEHAIPVSLVEVTTLEQAKALPCVFNNWAVFYKGVFQSVNLLDVAGLKRILK